MKSNLKTNDDSSDRRGLGQIGTFRTEDLRLESRLVTRSDEYEGRLVPLNHRSRSGGKNFLTPTCPLYEFSYRLDSGFRELKGSLGSGAPPSK